jgi:3D (Asp-Asp-Asp) domain-containing protein
MGLLFVSGGAPAVFPASPLVYQPAPHMSAFSFMPEYPVTLTAYNAVPEQTDSDPDITASGAFSNPEIIAARSRDLAEALPFGTIIEIDGSKASKKNCGYDIVAPIIGYRIVADTMHQRFTDRIDILFSTEANYQFPNKKVKNAGLILGICKGVTVRVVGKIDRTAMLNLPKTQGELSVIVHGGADTGLARK